MIKFIYYLTMSRSKKSIKKIYGDEFWNNFKRDSKEIFKEILPKTPKIGKSVFSFNYMYAPSYVAWHKAMLKNGLNYKQADELMWLMNEKMLTTVPKPLLHSVGKIYLNSFRKKAQKHIERQNKGLTHPYDWKIEYRNIDKNSFEIDIYECGYIKYAKDFNAETMLPGICRIDYLISNLMGNGFKRNQTLGDKCPCCNCHYELEGECKWSPEEGFEDRK